MKVERHSKIVELIGKYEIETQEELAERLNEAGFNVTQATVSRDIRELKLTKMQSESGRQRYMVLESPRGHLPSNISASLRTDTCPWTWLRISW